MALTSDPIQLSSLAPTAVIDETAQADRAMPSTSTSTASLSSRSSREVVSSISCKAQSKRGGKKRKASARTSPCAEQEQEQPASDVAPIIRRFSADKAHFKDIVHQFTGRSCPPPRPPAALLLPFLFPHNSSILAAAIAQSLATLDTISAYLLLHGSSNENSILLNEIIKSKSLTFLQVLKHSQDSCKRASNMGTFNSSPTFGFKSPCPSSVDPPQNLNIGMSRAQELALADMPNTRKSQQIAELESVLFKGNTSDNFLSLARALLKQMGSQSTPLAL